MEMSDIPVQSLSSVRQALAVTTLRKQMNQDKTTVSALLQGMEQANPVKMEQSVTPFKGTKIDVRL